MSTFLAITIPNSPRVLLLLNMRRLRWPEKPVMRWTGSECKDENWKSCLRKSVVKHQMKCVDELSLPPQELALEVAAAGDLVEALNGMPVTVRDICMQE